jgi:hypothetical protein
MGNKLEGKIAVITGATSGIGLATTFFISFIFHKCDFEWIINFYYFRRTNKVSILHGNISVLCLKYSFFDFIALFIFYLHKGQLAEKISVV